MRYSIRCRGRVLGTTELDFYQLVHGQHSGWLHVEPGVEELLNAISIGSSSIRAWLTRDSLPDGRRLTQPGFETSRECAAITAAVVDRIHLVLTLHREDGSELPTRDIILQDRIPWSSMTDLLDPYEGLDERQRAELDAAVEHDLAIIDSWNLEHRDETAEERAEFDRKMEARWRAVDESRYQVHLRLANPDDLPSDLVWTKEGVP